MVGFSVEVVLDCVDSFVERGKFLLENKSILPWVIIFPSTIFAESYENNAVILAGELLCLYLHTFEIADFPSVEVYELPFALYAIQAAQCDSKRIHRRIVGDRIIRRGMATVEPLPCGN